MRLKQRGAVLIFSLLILLVMTMTSVAAMNTATLEQRMTANDINHKLSFQAAESSNRAAERLIKQRSWRNQLKQKFDNHQVGYYDNGQLEPDLFNPDNWQAGLNCIASQPFPDQANTVSCYKLQHVSQITPLEIGGYNNPQASGQIIQIISRASDANGKAVTIIQSHYLKP